MNESRGHRLLPWAITAIVLVLLLAAGGLWLRRHHREIHEASRRAARSRSGPKMATAKVARPPAEETITLPGDVRGYSQTTVYAKLAGYVVKMNVDKGDRVEKGEIVAVLEAPEVDDQVRSAEADLVLKKRTAERYEILGKQGLVSKQDVDTVVSAYGVSAATLSQMKANQSYKIVRAPFAGVVTARYVDPGALIPAATGATQAALPLIDITNSKRLRVAVFVGQDVASAIRVGDPALIVEDQHPDHRISAPISRLASALDPRSRTMLCEIWVDNPLTLILPGVFVFVTLKLHVNRLPSVPAEAVFMRGSRSFIAALREGHARFVSVEVKATNGKSIEVEGAVLIGETILLNVPTQLDDGAAIQPASETPTSPR